MNNNLIELKQSSVEMLKTMLEDDFNGGVITEDQYNYFKCELQIDDLDYQYNLYIQYVLMI